MCLNMQDDDYFYHQNGILIVLTTSCGMLLLFRGDDSTVYSFVFFSLVNCVGDVISPCGSTPSMTYLKLMNLVRPSLLFQYKPQWILCQFKHFTIRYFCHISKTITLFLLDSAGYISRVFSSFPKKIRIEKFLLVHMGHTIVTDQNEQQSYWHFSVLYIIDDVEVFPILVYYIHQPAHYIYLLLGPLIFLEYANSILNFSHSCFFHVQATWLIFQHV